LQIVEMHVNIDCDGCEGKVRRALERLEGNTTKFCNQIRPRIDDYYNSS